MIDFCAIDPGVSGGFAWPEKNLLAQEIKTEKMPNSFKKIHDLMNRIPTNNFIIEAVRLLPQDFEDGRAYRISGKLLRNYYTIQGFAELLDKKVILVQPNYWSIGFLGHIPRAQDLGYVERKAELKRSAIKRFPKNKVVGWNADALLILDFA